ncbi:MAG: nucleoside hydrolase [Candidatus Promineofilum sp.]|nr:nucleoside hydrolase [Promineifilum sp.]
MSPLSSADDYRFQPLVTARAGLIVLWVAAVAVALALAPSAFAATQADWQFDEVARTVNGVSYESLTALITGVRLALGGLLLATAALLLSRPPRIGSLIAALALTTLPFTTSLFGNAAVTAYPAPWSALLGGLATVLAIAGGLALLALLFLFPDGRFYPARLRIPALIGMLLTAAGIVTVDLIENGWWVFLIALLGTILLALGGQALRYRSAGPTQRRQTAGFMMTILAVPLFILIGILGFSPLLTLMLNQVLLAMLASGLYLAARRSLWGEPPSWPVFTVATTALVLIAVAAAGLWWRTNQPQSVDLAALDVPTAAVPVLFDTDMGMDDISALLFLLQHPAVDLRAITVNGVAFVHCEDGVHNVLGLLNLATAPEIPVSCGREQPFPGGRPAPDEWRKGADNLYGAQVTTGGRKEDERPAAELLADTIAAAPDEITIIALGPLTNLAEAFQADPALAGKIKEIVIMGGAVDTPGNVINEAEGISNEYAEWNIFADPVAADIVLASGAPIILVPLDATNDVPFTRGFYKRLQVDALTRPAVFTYNLMYLNQWWLDGGMYWWDTLTAAAALDSDVVSLREAKLDVVTEEGEEIGRTVESPDGSPVRMATAADRPRFEALFLAVLNHE